MARFRVTAVREFHFEIDLDAKSSAGACMKLGEMIRAGVVEPVEEVISEVNATRLNP